MTVGISVFLSVVVPYHNDLHLLPSLMECLYSQDYLASKFEILLINDGSRTPDFEYISRKDGPSVKTLSLPRKGGAAAARNLGIMAARGDVIAFTDSDACPESTWLSEIVRAFETTSADALTGRIIAGPSIYIDPTKSIVTCNAACKKQVLLKLGMFDERFQTAWQEDTDLGLRLLSAGYRLHYDNRMCVYHPYKPVTLRFLLKHFRRRMNDVLLYRKHLRTAEPVLQLIAPRLTISGAEILLLCSVAVAIFLLFPLNLSFIITSSTFTVLTLVVSASRPSLRGCGAKVRLKSTVASGAVAFAVTLGHIAGSIKFRKFLL